MVLLKLGVITFATLAAAEFVGDSQAPEIKISEDTKKVSTKPKYQNPIYLDANRYHMVPSTSIVTFINPDFKGNLPPGSTNFMLNEVLSRSKKTTYPLNTKSLTEDFPGYTNDPNNKNQVLVSTCQGGSSGKGGECELGYTKVEKTQYEKDKTRVVEKKKRVRVRTEEITTTTEGEIEGSGLKDKTSESKSNKSTGLIEEETLAN